MLAIEQLKTQTITFRKTLVKVLTALMDEAHAIPDGWKNNAYWTAGHLVTTPQLLVRKLSGNELDVPAEYVEWFAKGTAPENCKGDNLPAYEQLLKEIVEKSEKLFDDFSDQLDQDYPNAYTTSAGVVLAKPIEALSFSATHDGIHLGLLLAMKRSLGK